MRLDKMKVLIRLRMAAFGNLRSAASDRKPCPRSSNPTQRGWSSCPYPVSI